MTTQSEREKIAARWLIEQDDPDFSDQQRAELARWLMQSMENCETYVRMVRVWRWTVLLYQDEEPLVYEKRRSKNAGASTGAGKRPPRRASFDRAFGSLLRARREEQGLSQADLAKRAGMRASEISEIETGARTLTLTSTYLLARALEMAASRLMSQLEKTMSRKPTVPLKRK
jgi:ferric-dicitrate binding protein FerR (iron transport regulator)